MHINITISHLLHYLTKLSYNILKPSAEQNNKINYTSKCSRKQQNVCSIHWHMQKLPLCLF